MLRDTYQHCRRWAHAGQVGTNAITLLAALDELLERRANDIPQRVAGAVEVQRCLDPTEKDDLGAAPARWTSTVSNKRWPQGTDG